MLDAHALSFVIRWVHVVAMTLMLGGAGLMALFAARVGWGEQERAGLKFALEYEKWFWLALGLQVISGVGNLGAFGANLPTSDTEWGRSFLWKLGIVLIFVLVSMVRTMFIVLFDNADGVALRAGLARVLSVTYAGTALILLGALWLAVALAHG